MKLGHILTASFSGRQGFDGERVDGAGQFVFQRRVDPAVPLDSALALESLGNDHHAEMRFPGGVAQMVPRSRVPRMSRGLVFNREA